LIRYQVGLACALALSLLAAGCGGSTGTTAAQGEGKTVAPPPRPGEDAMKEQMTKLLQAKKKLPKGVGIPKGK
jgi:hypothetical protein